MLGSCNAAAPQVRTEEGQQTVCRRIPRINFTRFFLADVYGAGGKVKSINIGKLRLQPNFQKVSEKLHREA